MRKASRVAPRWALPLLLIAAYLSGCDGGRPMPVPIDGGRRDAGRRDAGPRDGDVPMDAPMMDDGGRDASRPRDAGPPVCVTDPDGVIKLGQDPSRTNRVVAMAPAGRGFGLVWNESPMDEALSEIYGAFLSSSGDLGSEQRITRNTTNERPPSLAAVGTRWIASWVDNTSGTFELRSQLLESNLAASGPVHAVTATPSLAEDNPTLYVGSAGPLLAWVEGDIVAGTRTARVRPVGLDGAPTGTASPAIGMSQPGRLVLSELAAGPVVIWTEGVDGSAEVYMQGLSSTGAPRGSVTILSSEANVDGTVDAALGPTGGAVVFGVLVSGVRQEVRFRALDGEGRVLRDERVLANGTDASITPFAGGYAISYRALPAGSDTAQIRIALVDAFGDVVDDQLVSAAARTGGRTTIRTSGDGQLAIAWAEQTATGTDIRVTLVPCGAMP